ncbi:MULTISPECIES: EAL domain-containing protein [Citrobacter]|uniref:cyclic-guanylate-specific phosphodiesterase n=1 Tax=Citrobacter cronae TaxID=1748967 RepID=A0A7X1BLA6_9ENTR|nr:MULTISPECIES: EAL domain-containing protein [Citrobacter]MBS6074243.1 EAL domain-containing protein [Citrobacter freundii]MBC2619058.1 EAL domain-containing protein [Citrobacter cronae]MBY6245197.1 EAL domain-containing protein [Citrobacter werkmanii]MBY6252010.1 EAL domain-containing protein [Citrobacter werkmanii]MDM3301257.1 EAL domain-containing protein [Citrobacter sp. Cc227]
MRKALLPIFAAICLFVIGVFILNMQLWYSSSQEALGGARYAVKNMDNILNEAFQATGTAKRIAEKKCDLESQYQLGTEAALRPHLRTLIIIRQGKVWCTSLPGNRILLKQIPVIPDTNLLLAPAQYTVNEIPVLLYQTHFQTSSIIITISGVHIRGALNVPIKGLSYSLRVGDKVLGSSAEVKVIKANARQSGQVDSAKYPFSIIFDQPPLFSLKRLVTNGLGILIFILLISAAVAYAIDKYLNKNDTPEETLRRAIDKGEIVPFYQPIVNGRDGTLRGVEVLARWKHPRAGYISPASFIPVAEKSGLIVPLTQNLMKQVSANMNSIASKLPSGFHVGINFSASHITSPAFVEECLRYRGSFSRDDLNLVIEVTEREPLHVDDDLVQRLNTLHENGFVIALDDFGTGYSGLSYLHDLHIDYIKIDQSFVGRVNDLPDSTRILDCVLDLARKLSLSIVAEGVETKAQLDYLNKNNIVFLQGYYFYKPVTFTEFILILLSKPKVKVFVE